MAKKKTLLFIKKVKSPVSELIFSDLFQKKVLATPSHQGK